VGIDVGDNAVGSALDGEVVGKYVGEYVSIDVGDNAVGSALDGEVVGKYVG